MRLTASDDYETNLPQPRGNRALELEECSMGFRLVSAFGWFVLITLIVGGPQAVAQDRKRLEPADSRTPAPEMNFDSAFSDYRPFREQPRRSWKDANQEVADSARMGSMANMPGMVPDMDSKPSATPKGTTGGPGHDVGAMPAMASKPGATSKGNQGTVRHDMAAMPGRDAKPNATPKSNQRGVGHDMATMSGIAPQSGNGAKKGGEGAAGHDASAVKNRPGMKKPAVGAPMVQQGDGAIGMTNKQTLSSHPVKTQVARLTATGVFQRLDTANGTVELTHDPIEAMGWPKMTMFFRLKGSSLASGLKKGDRVEFLLEQSAAGYVISALKQGAANPDAKQAK